MRWLRRPSRRRASLRAAMRSDPGRIRDQNQDACLVLAERGLFAVADGMGGHQAGDVAARLAVTNLPSLVDRELRGGRMGVGAALERAVVELSALVQAEAATDPALAGMGTTIVLALVTGGVAHVAHAGDSRAYLFRRRRLHRLTNDHSYAAELVRAGVLGRAAARAHPQGHGLTRAVGMPGPIQPEVRRLVLDDGDRLLLCSDGLTKMLPDAWIGELLAGEREPEGACTALVDAANRAGGQDNVSAVVVDVRLPAGAPRPADDQPVTDPGDGLQQP
jgi:serine/threonine protein phosphatase PrpC